MSEDSRTLGLETAAEKTNREQTSRLYSAVQKYFEILELLQKALGVTSVSHFDEQIKLLFENDLTQLQPQDQVRDETDNKLDYKKNNTTEELAKQKDDLAFFKLAASQSKTLKKWSHDLRARSQQLTAKSTELRIISEDLVARSCSAKESKYDKLRGGAPTAHPQTLITIYYLYKNILLVFRYSPSSRKYSLLIQSLSYC